MKNFLACRSHRPTSIRRKLALLTGGGAAVLAAQPTESQAEILPSLTLPLSTNPIGGLSTIWDVDGNGAGDFSLDGVANHVGTAIFGWASINRSGGSYITNDFIVPARGLGVAKLGLASAVGPSLVPAYSWNKPAVVTSFLVDRGSGRNEVRPPWNRGETGNFGFRFVGDTGVHYGWGELSFGAAPGSGFTINKAYYNSVAGESILVGQTTTPVPESSYFALVAVGAAGLAIWRRQRRKAL